METIEDYIVNRLFKEGCAVEGYSYNDISFGSNNSGQLNLITIHFNRPLNERLLKSVQNYTRDIFKAEHEGFQEYNPYHDPNVTDVACNYENFEDPSVLICLSNRIKRFINNRISKFKGYKVEYPAILLNNDDFMDKLEDVLEELLEEVLNYDTDLFDERLKVFSFKPSVCDKFSDYIYRKQNIEY